ncbi:MAG: hypothetical protein WD491_06015 [Balneolales bacterium]
MITFVKYKAAALLLLCMTMAACSVFETREPEPPGRGDGSAFIQPDQATDVIDNLKNAIASLNHANYLRCLSDDRFEYTPSGQAQNTDPDLWQGWSKDDESVYFNNMRASSESFTGHQLQVENENPDFNPDDTQQYSADYTLTVDNNEDIPKVATGTMRLTLKAGDDGLWSIVEWVDSQDSGSFSWSDIRASYR